MTKPYKFIIHNSSFIILIIINYQLSIINCAAQDKPTGQQPLLPFQQPAQETNDEQLALQFFQSRDYAKAAEIYEKVYANKPSYYIYTYYLAALVEDKEYDKAEKLVKQAKKADPDALKFMVDMGYIYYREGNPDKAKKQYEEALKKLPANQQQIYDLSNAFIIRGENEYAIRTFLRGRELMNNTYPFSFELASAYERMGNFKDMVVEYFHLLEYNKSYLPTVQDRLQTSLADDRDNTKNEIFRKALLEKAQKEPDKTYYSELLWWYSVQQKDFELALVQAKSLDRRLKEDGNRVYQLAKLCVSNEQYDAAVDAYSYLVSKGEASPFYETSQMELLNTRLLKVISKPNPPQKDLLEFEKEYTEAVNKRGISSRSVSLVRSLAHLEAFYLSKINDATELLNRAIELQDLNPQAKAECKLELADISLFGDDVWEATLLYQQVYQDYKNDEIGQMAKFKNAKLSYYIGEFGWAETQLDILKAATSKLIANDAMDLSLLISENYDSDSGTVALGLYARADLLEYRNQYDAALQTLDSIPLAFTTHTIFDEMLYKKAMINMKQGKLQEADTLLGTLVKDFPVDILADQALMTRGKLNEEQLANKEKAMQYFETLMMKYPGSIYAVEARKHFRILRGDKGF